MPALHIKTFTVGSEEGVLRADLQYAKEAGKVAVFARLLRVTRNGKGRETLLGMAGLNVAGELVNIPETVGEREVAELEKAIAEALAYGMKEK